MAKISLDEKEEEPVAEAEQPEEEKKDVSPPVEDVDAEPIPIVDEPEEDTEPKEPEDPHKLWKEEMKFYLKRTKLR